MRGDPPGVEVVIQKGEEEKGRIAVEKIKIESVGENGKEREDGFSGQHASMRQAFSSILNTDEAYIHFPCCIPSLPYSRIRSHSCFRPRNRFPLYCFS